MDTSARFIEHIRRCLDRDRMASDARMAAGLSALHPDVEARARDVRAARRREDDVARTARPADERGRE